MAKLNNEKVTISFAPASQADEDALNSLLPEGEITDESQLPSNIPFYINVKPQLKVNGKVMLELGETSLGEEYTIKQTLYTPTRTNTFGQPRLLISGGYYAVNTIVQSVSEKKLRNLRKKILDIKTLLLSEDKIKISKFTREDILGNMVYAASLGYYAQMIVQGKIVTKALKTQFELVASSGIIGYKPKIAKRFGLPVGLSVGAMNCDLIDSHMTEQINRNERKHIQSNQQLGKIGSSLEHQILEQFFNTGDSTQGFSAVKAIQLANSQGQKIFTLTENNYAKIIPQLQLAPAAIADIKAAAMAGLTVTTHEKRISIDGYTGEGYIILNERGTGVWLINGGLYGANKKASIVTNYIALGLYIISVFQEDYGLDNLTKELCLTAEDLVYLESASTALLVYAGAIPTIPGAMGPIQGLIAGIVIELAWLLLGRMAMMMHLTNQIMGRGHGDACHTDGIY